MVAVGGGVVAGQGLGHKGAAIYWVEGTVLRNTTSIHRLLPMDIVSEHHWVKLPYTQCLSIPVLDSLHNTALHISDLLLLFFLKVVQWIQIRQKL